MLPGGISADLNHSQTAACFKSQPCRFHISLICFIWRQTVAGFRRDGWDQWAVVLPTVDQFFIRQTHSIIVENLPVPSLRRLILPPPPAAPPQHPPKKAACRHLLIAQLHHIIGMLAMVSVPNNLAALTWSFEMRNYRPGAKTWPQRLSSTVLIVSPSALPDVHSWQYN